MPEIKACPLTNLTGVGCKNCGGALTGRRSVWCDSGCSHEWLTHHMWAVARNAALDRDGKCVKCGITDEALFAKWKGTDGAARTRAIYTMRLEVNHIVPIAGWRSSMSCFHHLDNLEVLCHACHLPVTASQRSLHSHARRIAWTPARMIARQQDLRRWTKALFGPKRDPYVLPPDLEAAIAATP